jgi:hypothetical protein
VLPVKLTGRDGVASVLVTAVVIPYVGYLVRGVMPFIQDARGMAATALLLGAAAVLTAGRFRASTTVGTVEVALTVVVLTFGVVALALAETAAAEVLLAVLVGEVVLVWAIQMLHHAGVFTGGPARPALPRH